MKFNDIIRPEIGKSYRLSTNKKLGDYSGETVLVEKGPRGSGDNEQYRVIYGPGAYDVDWIETYMFEGSKEVTEPPGYRYSGITDTNPT